MDLRIPVLPTAGTNFAVSLERYKGKGQIAIYVDDRMLLEKECADPPCHEIVFLTRNLAGRTLKVVATANDQTEERSFIIGMKEAEGGAMVAG